MIRFVLCVLFVLFAAPAAAQYPSWRKLPNVDDKVPPGCVFLSIQHGIHWHLASPMPTGPDIIPLVNPYGLNYYIRVSPASFAATHPTSITYESVAAEIEASYGNVYALAIHRDQFPRANHLEESNGRIFLVAPGHSAKDGQIVDADGKPVKWWGREKP